MAGARILKVLNFAKRSERVPIVPECRRQHDPGVQGARREVPAARALPRGSGRTRSGACKNQWIREGRPTDDTGDPPNSTAQGGSGRPPGPNAHKRALQESGLAPAREARFHVPRADRFPDARQDRPRAPPGISPGSCTGAHIRPRRANHLVFVLEFMLC